MTRGDWKGERQVREICRVESLVGFRANAVEETSFRELEIGCFADRLAAALPGVVEGRIDAPGKGLAQQELVIVGVRQSLAAGEEVGRIQVTAVG